MSIFNYENKKPQIPSCASEGRRHVCPAGIRGFPLPKGNRDADERRFVDFNLIFAAFAFFAVKKSVFDGSDAL